MTKVILTPLERALKTLSDGLSAHPQSRLEKDGMIQRFEYCLELCWKSAKKVLLEGGIESDVPKDVFRQMAKMGWLESAEPWMNYVEARNKTSHAYNEEIADEIYRLIPQFYVDAVALLLVLKSK